MPHSIRDQYLNNTSSSGANRNNNNRNTVSDIYSAAFGVNNLGHAATNPGPLSGTSSTNSSSTTIPSRGYNSTFNTSYNINPATLPSYSYTNRYLQRTPSIATATSTSASSSSLQQNSSTSSSSSATGGPQTYRMPQYPPPPHAPPPQYQYYGSNMSASGSSGPGYSSTYRGGGNSEAYNARYSSYYQASSNLGGSNTQSKTVFRMDCKYCSAVVCLRGMKAMLLADTTVELYSTDHPPGSVQLIDKDYTTSNCECKIRDVACRVCGNVIGYHITQPCQKCLKAPNNGHFWMFHTDGVVGQNRLNMDLGKLVQGLVQLPGSSTVPATVRNPISTATTTATPVRPSVTATLAPGGAARLNALANMTRAAASTTRQTSITRQEQQQRREHLLTQQSGTATTISQSSSTSAPSVSSLSSPQNELWALELLSRTESLTPLRWEQLPHPDLDIDLDPSTMGGEPLFGDQWMELVMRTAEAAVANMSLALDQEEETERYMANIALEDGEDESEGDGEHGQGTEREEDSEPHERLNVNGEIVIEQLIDGLDEFGIQTLASPPAPGTVRATIVSVSVAGDEDKEGDVDPEILQDRGRRTRQQDALPNQAPAPGQEPSSASSRGSGQRRSSSSGDLLSSSSSSSSSSTSSLLSDSSHRRASSSSDSTLFSFPRDGIDEGKEEWDERLDEQERGEIREGSGGEAGGRGSSTSGAMASAMVAKMAASAAAADAATAAHNLVFGRRNRRDYDMMCR